MDCADVSDLEEGEILEYEFCPSENNLINLGRISVNRSNELQQRELQNKFSDSSGLIKKDYLRTNLEDSPIEYCNQVDVGKNKYELELISSSDGEYRTNEDKHLSQESKNSGIHSDGDVNRGGFKRTYFSQVTYGTLEDLMSDIGETIKEDNWCNYKRRRIRESKKYSYGLFYHGKSGSCEIPPYKVHSSQSSSIRSKHKKRKKSSCESHLSLLGKGFEEESPKNKLSGTRKRKKKDVYWSDKIVVKKNEEVGARKGPDKKFRDFDETRKIILEKLEKKKAEEKLGEVLVSSGEGQEEMSKIHQDERLVESTDGAGTVEMDAETQEEDGRTLAENEGADGDDDDDEVNLIKLRLMALASNRRKENSENDNFSRAKNCEIDSESGGLPKSIEGNGSGENRKDSDLDRHELLLRAEALKTALLKKHQKRLNKLKREKFGGCAGQDIDRSEPPAAEGNKGRLSGATDEKDESEGSNLDEFIDSRLDVDSFKENLNKDEENKLMSANPEAQAHASEGWRISKTTGNSYSNGNLKKINSKARSKKKKKKSDSEVKENDQNDAVEEDDRTLRSQLLCDLIKKKSLKDLGKKSVLMDSIQTPVGRAPVGKLPEPEVRQKPAPPLKNVGSVKVEPKRAPGKPRTAAKVPKAEIQRIIVHLGSEDSSDEDASPMGGLPGEAEKHVNETGTAVSDGAVAVASTATVAKPSTESIRASYEDSVEQLLSQARKKIEGESRKASAVDLTTPEAVYKHLPPSQRMEYIRLKQKIAERERQKNLKSRNSGTPSALPAKTETAKTSGKSVPEKPEERVSGGKEGRAANAGGVSATTRQTPVPNNLAQARVGRNLSRAAVKANEKSPASRALIGCAPRGRPRTETPGLGSHPPVANATPAFRSGRENPILAPSLLSLISKLKLMLKKIKIEKTIEDNYEKEITKLKSQLSLFEKKKSEQRSKIRKLAEDSMKIYKVMQKLDASARKTPPPKAEAERGAGEERQGSAPPAAGLESQDEPKTAIKENGPENLQGENRMSESPSAGFVRYDSPLQAFQKTSNGADVLDPNAIVCQFDLMGVCKDEECAYQHLRAS